KGVQSGFDGTIHDITFTIHQPFRQRKPDPPNHPGIQGQSKQLPYILRIMSQTHRLKIDKSWHKEVRLRNQSLIKQLLWNKLVLDHRKTVPFRQGMDITAMVCYF